MKNPLDTRPKGFFSTFLCIFRNNSRFSCRGRYRGRRRFSLPEGVFRTIESSARGEKVGKEVCHDRRERPRCPGERRIGRNAESGLERLAESGEHCGEEDRRENRTDPKADARDARSTRTGWEKERSDYLRYRTLGAAQLQGSYRSGSIGQALDHRRSGGIGGSIGAGQSARAPLFALTTARLLAGLQSTAKAEEPVEDCTTMDMPKERRKRREQKMSMQPHNKALKRQY